jgi:Kef-type K+ transport system membrane component KefB
VGGHPTDILLQIFVIFTAAKVLGFAGQKIQIPPVISEIVAGILIGPYALGLVRVEEWTLALAELGAIVLLFSVGLEQKLTDLLKVGRIAMLVAVLGVVLPFLLGWGVMLLFDHSQTESTFMGAAMVATSIGITARVLRELGVLRTLVATVILGAAVVDDILGMIILAVASSLTTGINYLEIFAVVGLALGFTIFIVLVGRRVIRQAARQARQFAASDPVFALAMVICLGLSVVAAKIQIAAIIGAFLAGLVFSEEELAEGLREEVSTLYEFLVPFFFVGMGMQMDITVLARGDVLLLAGVVTLLAIVGKLVGCGLGAYELGWRPALQVGVGMVPRGEVGIIVAAIGLNMAAISDEVYSVTIIMVLVTTLLAPPFLKTLFSQQPVADAELRSSGDVI